MNILHIHPELTRLSKERAAILAKRDKYLAARTVTPGEVRNLVAELNEIDRDVMTIVCAHAAHVWPYRWDVRVAPHRGTRLDKQQPGSVEARYRYTYKVLNHYGL